VPPSRGACPSWTKSRTCSSSELRRQNYCCSLSRARIARCDSLRVSRRRSTHGSHLHPATPVRPPP